METKQARGLLLLSNLPSLQNLIKRAPKSYKEEFLLQWNHYENLRRVVESDAGALVAAGGEGNRGRREQEEKWRDLVGFIAQVAPCYPSITSSFPTHLSEILLSNTQSAMLSPDSRKTLVQSLVLLRNRDFITNIDLLKTLFPLLSQTTSSQLRSYILKTILNDIKASNLKTKNHKLNKMVQGLLFGMVERGMSTSSGIESGQREGTGTKKGKKEQANTIGSKEAMWAVKLASEPWRKGIWKDSKTVSIVALACFHPNTKVQSAALHFFLTIDGAGTGGVDDTDDEDEDDGMNVGKIKHQREINKKKKSTERAAQKALKAASKKRKRKEASDANDSTSANFSALHLINDPQTFAENLHSSLVKFDKVYTIEHKILIMQLFGRVSSIHRVLVMSFYSYIVKYLTHSQLYVTSILVSLTQSIHPFVLPDILKPVVRKIANEFINPGVGSELVAIGLNTVREISKRQPGVFMPEAQDEGDGGEGEEGTSSKGMGGELELLEDLIGYRKSRDKGVMMAARGLLALYREVAPGLLKKRERGKLASINKDSSLPLKYGESRDQIRGIQGLELLQTHLNEKRAAGAGAEGEGEEGEEDDERDWNGWEVESSGDESDDSGGWINVSDDDDAGGGAIDIDVSSSDSEDEDGEDGAGKKGKGRKRRKVDIGDVVKGKGKEEVEVEVEGEVGAGGEEEIKLDVDEESDEEADSDDEEDEDEDDSELGSDEEDADVELDGTKASDDAVLSLATTKILTPADFAKLAELRLAAAETEASQGTSSASRRRLAQLKKTSSTASARVAADGDEFVTESEIVGLRKKQKQDYEERMASIQKGREGREKFGSKKGKKNKGAASSSTNEDKKKTKVWKMLAHSQKVRSKKHASLRDKQQKLRSHITNMKKRKRKH